MQATIAYGKNQVSLYRTYARPMMGLPRIPESAFIGRANTLFGVDVDVEVFGDNFLPSYTHGDNSNVVATDTMKNFILRQALEFDGSTIEGFLAFLGRGFLATYPQMQSLRLTGREAPFDPVTVPSNDGSAFVESDVLFSRSRDGHVLAVLEFVRDGGSVRIAAHRCGRIGLQLIKVTGSSFTRFVRDGYTTLPDAVDRPLFIYLDVCWRYADVEEAVAADLSRYVAAEQVHDLIQTVFHRFVSKSIQNLVHEMGTRILERFPQLVDVSFEAQNRLWDTAAILEADSRIKVYCDPRPPYGLIRLTLNRSE